MGRHFTSFKKELFKYHDLFSTKGGSVEGECQLHTTVRLFCRECLLRCYHFAIYLQLLLCLLIHQGSLYGVLFTRDQVLIRHGIHDRHVLYRDPLAAFRILVFCCGANFDTLIGDRLSFIFDILMDCHFTSFKEELFKHNYFFTCQGRTIKSKGDIHAAIRFFGCERFFSLYCFSVHLQLLLCLLIHQGSLYGVLFTRDQVIVGDGIYDGHLFCRYPLVCPCLPVLCCGPDLDLFFQIICYSPKVHGIVIPLYADIKFHQLMAGIRFTLQLLNGINAIWECPFSVIRFRAPKPDPILRGFPFVGILCMFVPFRGSAVITIFVRDEHMRFPGELVRDREFHVSHPVQGPILSLDQLDVAPDHLVRTLHRIYLDLFGSIRYGHGILVPVKQIACGGFCFLHVIFPVDQVSGYGFSILVQGKYSSFLVFFIVPVLLGCIDRILCPGKPFVARLAIRLPGLFIGLLDGDPAVHRLILTADRCSLTRCYFYRISGPIYEVPCRDFCLFDGVIPDRKVFEDPFSLFIRSDRPGLLAGCIINGIFCAGHCLAALGIGLAHLDVSGLLPGNG